MSNVLAPDRPRAAPAVTRLIVYEVVMTVGFGLPLLLMPQGLLGLLGVAPAPAPQLLARLFGTGLLYVGFLHAWQSRVRSMPALRGLAWANILQDVLGAVILCIACARGTINAVGWVLAGAFVATAVVNAVALRAFAEGTADRPVTP